MAYVNRTPVFAPSTLPSFGVDVLANRALIMAQDQPGGTRAIEIAYLLVPGPSWVAVHAVEGGLPGRKSTDA